MGLVRSNCSLKAIKVEYESIAENVRVMFFLIRSYDIGSTPPWIWLF